jgi:hypothetical protein
VAGSGWNLVDVRDVRDPLYPRRDVLDRQSDGRHAPFARSGAQRSAGMSVINLN